MKSQKGITLIALVITIIVMLILVGVTVTVSLNGGLFTTAKQATEETQIAKESEELLMAAMGALGENGEVVLSKLDTSLPEGFQKTGEGTYKSPTGNIFTVGTNGKITLVGEGNGEQQETPVTPPATPTIALNQKTITAEIESGTTGEEIGTITATVTNVDGDLTWSITPTDSGLELVDTDNENVKKVTASKAVENATITVSYGDVSDTCSVTVTEVEMITITFVDGNNQYQFFSLTKDDDYVYIEELDSYQITVPAGSKVEKPFRGSSGRMLSESDSPMLHDEYLNMLQSGWFKVELDQLPKIVGQYELGLDTYKDTNGNRIDMDSFYPVEDMTVRCMDDE